MLDETRGHDMAEAFTAAAAPVVVGAGGITLASMFPGIDLSSVVGAFGGAFFFILFAKDISNWQRIGYLVVGWVGGYFSAAELMSLAWTKTSGFSSFVAGLFCVAICISLLEAVQTGKPPRWLQFVLNRFLGKREPE
jgi:ABC-type Co2+ transport system permease subunit